MSLRKQGFAGSSSFSLEAQYRRPGPPPPGSEVIMQVLECTQYFRAPKEGVSTLRHNEVPVLRLFGCTMEGHSVLMNVYNFQPYLWVEAPPGWNPSVREYFRAQLNTLLVPQTKLSETIVSIEEHEKESLLYYSVTGEKRTFLKLICQLPGNVPKIRHLVEGMITCPKIWEGSHRFLTYESNVLFPLRFMVDGEIGGSNWVRVKHYKPTLPKTSNCQIEIDVSTNMVDAYEATGEWMKIAPFRLLSLDIECQGRKGFFPEAKVDPVIQIAVHGTVQGDSTSPPCRKVFTLGSCASIIGAQVH
eukprot:PhF_6_TR42981/c0_g1_i5/m.65503/K02327/POLD1; DNA polymerase delta subunit 1